MRDALPDLYQSPNSLLRFHQSLRLRLPASYRLIVDVIDHRAVFTPGIPYWTASTRFRARLLEPSGNILGQWDALGSGRRWNMWGYATAQAVAQESYNMAVAELLSALAPVSYARTATPKTPDSPRLSVTPPAPTSMGSTFNNGGNPLGQNRWGYYALPVAINGVLTLHFILDSGATKVNIPADVALTLLRTGTITDSDFLPGATYVLADEIEAEKPSADAAQPHYRASHHHQCLCERWQYG